MHEVQEVHLVDQELQEKAIKEEQEKGELREYPEDPEEEAPQECKDHRAIVSSVIPGQQYEHRIL